jgi:hypothetical protein
LVCAEVSDVELMLYVDEEHRSRIVALMYK